MKPSFTLFFAGILTGAVWAANPGTIQGRVVVASDAMPGIPGAKVRLLSGYVGSPPVDSTLTDSSGAFAFVASAGPHVLETTARGYWSRSKSKWANNSVTVKSDSLLKPLVLMMPVNAAIQGHVAYPLSDSNPPQGLSIRLNSLDGDVMALGDSTRTDANGDYRFPYVLAQPFYDASGDGPGGYFGYTLTVCPAAGPCFTSAPFGTKPDDTTVVDILLSAGTNSGSYTGQFALPVAGSLANKGAKPLVFSRDGKFLTVDLTAASVSRTLEIFGVNGVRERSIRVPAGQSRITLPGRFAPENGFLFRLR